MKFLLDENFPLPLYDRLRTAGYDVDHLIALGQRGLPDRLIRQHLATEDLVFLAQDTEFLDVPETTGPQSSCLAFIRICPSPATESRW